METLFRVVAAWPVQALFGSLIVGPLATVLAVMASVLVGVLFYRVFEVPLLKFLLSQTPSSRWLPFGRAEPAAVRQLERSAPAR